ncbi:hypothetical protein [Mycobacterium interjectum]|uniref:hypothetical protein n=1 Tax=Mycobacterium interjectum TaxID=33895 RepID=UPI00142F9B6E|nr:hypothetical protein [Mycobacterium interjectum]MCV7092671.1 hypothetical protein [Mycobacterium interjectum]
MGIDLLREHLRTLAVQSRRKRLTRNVTPHPCIVAYARSPRKGVERRRTGTEWSGKPTTEGKPPPATTSTEEVFVFLPDGPRR